MGQTDEANCSWPVGSEGIENGIFAVEKEEENVATTFSRQNIKNPHLVQLLQL